MLAQLGGGTFAVALDVTEGASSDPMTTLRESLAAVFGPPFVIEGREIPVTVKSGLALYPTDGTQAAALVQNAEAALRNARASGERVLTFSLEQRSEVVARLALEHKLRTAIERQQFELHYQPKMNIHSRRIEGVEALIRWRDPSSGLVAPGTFLPLLESTGLIVEVGNWVLEQAAKDSQQWQRLGLPTIRVAVNVSTIQLRRPDFADRFLQVLAPWADSARGLDIEITEGALFDDCAAEVQKLQRLRAAGVRVAIDDFGTGYSSLSRLSDLPIDTLKIDRSFVSRLPDDSLGRTLVATIISLAHAFGMSVVAEGVETEEQLAALRDMDSDEAQGFLMSKPVTRDAFTELLEKGQRAPIVAPWRAPRRQGYRVLGDERHLSCPKRPLGYNRRMATITPDEARAYADRWAAMEAFELDELRRTSIETKLLQLASLMASRDLFAHDSARDKGILEVRERWLRLRQLLHV